MVSELLEKMHRRWVCSQSLNLHHSHQQITKYIHDCLIVFRLEYLRAFATQI